jgi:hypothetical protein
MVNNILINLLSSLTKKEINKFRSFLVSPFFNNRKYIVKFFDALTFYCPHYNNTEFKLDEFRNSLKMKKSTFKSVQSKLLNSLLQYFTYVNIEKNNFAKLNHLSEELIYRNHFEIFAKRIKRFENRELPNLKIDSFFFFNNYLLNTNKINKELLSKLILSKKNKVYKIIDDIDKCYKFLLVFIISIAISDYIKSKILYIDYNVDINNTILNSFIKEFNIPSLIRIVKKDKTIYSFLNIYIRLIDCFEDFSNLKKYEEYEKLVFKNIDNMSEDEKNFHIYNLINYCTIPKNTNDLELLFKRKVFELYNIILKNEYYIDSKNKYLPISLFRSILIISVVLQEFEWAKKFISNYSTKVSPDQINNIKNFGLAYLYNAKSDFIKSLEYLYKIKIDRFIYKFDVRDMQLKLLYDINDFESVLEVIHNYKDFLRESDFSTKEIKIFRGNFIKCVEKLAQHKSGNTKIDIGYMQRFILRENQIANKNWLLSKVNEILEKKIIIPQKINGNLKFKNNKIIVNVL